MAQPLPVALLLTQRGTGPRRCLTKSRHLPVASLNMGLAKWRRGLRMASRASMAMAGDKDRGPAGLCSANDGKVIGNEFLSSYGEVVRGLGGEPESLLRE